MESVGREGRNSAGKESVGFFYQAFRIGTGGPDMCIKIYKRCPQARNHRYS